ncbi:hypothetical protein PISL3812_04331 [Talaromyces islandicus]|uniref:Conidiation-specific protein 10 n=1 Tax=Talaromyces islandicus TaxID=28573 RepID=A0A0U1LV86_TALIS|nr:hypothetical protein PISL3812_04331 [Talaromyces islandicus]
MLPGDVLVFFFLRCIFAIKAITVAMALSRKLYQVSSQNFIRCTTQIHINFQANHASRWFLGSVFLVGKRNLSIATGPQQAQHPNPANFANRSKEEMAEIGRKGGQKGGRARGVGGFHNMDPDKQRAIAAKGGRASKGAFAKGSKRARVAGRKGGKSRKLGSLEDEYSDVFE